MASQIVRFDTYRTLGFASITNTFQVLGSAFSHTGRIMCITNNTDGDMIFSIDGVNNQLFIPRNTFKLFDLVTNKECLDQTYVLIKGTQFYVKYATVPTTGAVYLEVVYGQGD